MGITLSCKGCHIVFRYGERRDVPVTCPECNKGPFNDWYTTLGTEATV